MQPMLPQPCTLRLSTVVAEHPSEPHACARLRESTLYCGACPNSHHVRGLGPQNSLSDIPVSLSSRLHDMTKVYDLNINHP